MTMEGRTREPSSWTRTQQSQLAPPVDVDNLQLLI